MFILGMVLCLGAPIFINTLTGVNIYDPDLKYSMSFFQFRICCATVFLHLLIYFFVLNKIKIRLKLSIFNKPVMWAAPLIIRGGFDGLGDPDLDIQHEASKDTRRLNSSPSITAIEMERNSLSLSATQMEYHRQKENSKATMPLVNPEGCPAVPIPIQTGITSSSRFTDFKYVMGLGNPCPWVNSPTPPHESPKLPLCSVESEPDPSYKSDHTIKKVRLNEIEQKLETNNQKFFMSSKSSNSEPTPDLISKGVGEINNPNPASDKDMQSRIKDLFKKFI